MNTTDAIAIYAAVVATGVGAWDFFKWWYSESLNLSGFVSSNMKTFGGATTPDTQGRTYTLLRVQNRGAVPCVVQLVHLTAYKNLFDQIRGKVACQAVVNHTTNFGPAIPHRLEKGEEFSSGAIQDEEFEKWSREHRLFMGISHTMSSKPFSVRKIPPTVNMPRPISTFPPSFA